MSAERLAVREYLYLPEFDIAVQSAMSLLMATSGLDRPMRIPRGSDFRLIQNVLDLCRRGEAVQVT